MIKKKLSSFQRKQNNYDILNESTTVSLFNLVLGREIRVASKVKYF